MSDVSIRPAVVEDHATIAGVLDSAMLATDDLAVAIEKGRVLVAVAGGRVLGALVYSTADASAHVDAIAVRRRRRGQGIGTALVRELARGRERVTAEFDAGVRPFYESLGFTIESLDDDRFRGTFRVEGQ